MGRMSWGAPAVLLLLVVMTTQAGADFSLPQQRGNQRFELQWKTPPTSYLHYAVVSQAKIDPLEPLPTGAVNDAPSLSYAHYMGHEFDNSGTLQAIHAPFIMEDVLIQLAMQIPEKKCNAGFEWERAWNLERLYDLPALALNSKYKLPGSELCRNVDCAVITGVHEFAAPDREPPADAARWFAFRAETTAWFNPEQGRLEAAEITLHAARWRAKVAKVAAARIEHHWAVRFEFSKDLDSTAGRYLNDKVSSAIARGAEQLQKLQNADGAWPHGTRVRGGTGLALLTLLTCDVPADDPAVVRGFEALKQADFEETYSVAVSLMAYEARYITEAERRAYLSEGEKFPEFKRELTDEDRNEMQKLVDWLVENQNRQKNPFWNYTPDGETWRFDFSNTQYALLGLAAALRCNVRIPAGVISKLVEQTIAHQMPDGPKVKRVVGYKPPKDGGRDAGRSTYASRVGKARGWNYSSKAKWDRYSETTDAYGSMTTAGLTCVLVGLDIVESMNNEQLKAEFGSQAAIDKWKKAANESLEDGMCWLEHWFSVTRNPNRGRTWYLYYMYGLERVMMLAQTRRLGVHDWYAEGASVLVSLQQENGSWGGMPDTCFALLFLKKGTVPARKPLTGSK